MENFPVTTIVGIGGLVVGILFGGVTRWANFCTLGALADIQRYGDFRRMRAWLLAIAVAMVGAHLLDWSGAIDLGNSIYLHPVLGWFGAITGGAMFGYGAVLAGGCGGRSLIRLGGGDCRALVSTLFLAVFAYMTMRGFTGVGREWLESMLDVDVSTYDALHQGIPELAAVLAGIDAGALRLTMVVVSGLLIAMYCFRDADFRQSLPHLISGAMVGLLICAGWFVTGVLGADEFDPTPMMSLTFVRPVGDALQYMMTFSGATVSFGVAVVGGVIVGAWGVAQANGSFRLIGFQDTRDLLHHMAGGVLMGIGGVTALGCTIGQAITGVSTLSLGSVLATVSILVGGGLAIRILELDTADHILE